MILTLSSLLPAMDLKKYLIKSAYEVVLAENYPKQAPTAANNAAATETAKQTAAQATMPFTKQELIYVSLNEDNLPAQALTLSNMQQTSLKAAKKQTATQAQASVKATDKPPVSTATETANTNELPTASQTAYAKAYAVNYFQAAQAVKVEDYGPYSKVTNLNPNIELQESTADNNSKKIAFTLPANSTFYYQGLLEQQEIPWLFNITYKLDGQELSASEIAGKSGDFNMELTVAPNPNADLSFYESYLLQINFALPLNNFTELQAPNAQISVAAGNSNVSFILLPKQTAVFTLHAKVTDCNLPSSMFYALPITFDLDKFALPTDKMGELKQLTDGVTQLNNAASALDKGFQELNNGIQALSGGANALANGGSSLVNGAYTLASGLEQYAAGVKAYVDGVSQVNDGLQRINQELSPFKAILSEKLATVGKIKELLLTLDQQMAPFAEIIDQILTNQNLKELLAKAQNNNLETELNNLYKILDELIAYLENLQNDINALNNLSLPNYRNRIDLTALELPSADVLSEAILHNLDLSAVDSVLTNSQLTPEEASELKANLLNGVQQAVKEAVSANLATYQAQVAEAKNNLQTAIQATDAELAKFIANVQNLSARSAPDLAQILQILKTTRTNLQAATSLFSELSKILKELNGSLPSESAAKLPANYQDLRSKLQSFISSLDSISQLVADGPDGRPSLFTALTMLADGTSQLMSKAPLLIDGGAKVTNGSNQLAAGIYQYVNGAFELANGSNTLAYGSMSYAEGFLQFVGGMQQLYWGTRNMDAKTKAKIQEIVSDLLGQNFEAHSFISAANQTGTVSQFIFVYPGVNLPRKQAQSKEEETSLSFFEKIKALFS